jgi:predicted dehydrogenase
VSTEQANVGIIGAGNILRQYVDGLRQLPELVLVRLADIDASIAHARAEEFGVPSAGTVEDLLADRTVDVVVNLTPPSAHEAVTVAALQAGKHAYSEKPLALSVESADRILAAAQAAGRVVGCAPDTFLGSAGLTARAALASGVIGEVVGASAFILHTRLEEWHPDPRAFFAAGGGPVLDLGPYVVTALVAALGPVSSTGAAGLRSGDRREVSSPGRIADTVPVAVNTHATALLGFETGVVATTMFSFDVWPTPTRQRSLPFIEIYGDRGALSLPNPNHFDGDVRVRLHNDEQWRPVPATGQRGLGRGLGVRDLVRHLGGAPHHASASLARHVLEVLLAISAASPTPNCRSILSRPH